jgi:hypothetical protein
VLEVGVSEVIARRVWVQADMWLQKVVAVGGEMGTLVPHGLHTIVALVEFEGIFLPPSFYRDVEDIFRLVPLLARRGRCPPEYRHANKSIRFATWARGYWMTRVLWRIMF